MRKKQLLLILWMLALLSLLVVGCDDEEVTEEPAADESALVEEAPAEVEADETDEAANETPLKQIDADTYTHPSGAFEMMPFGSEYAEDDSSVIFYDDQATVLVFYGEAGDDLADVDLADFATELLDGALVQSGLVDDFQVLDEEPQEWNDGYLLYFESSSADYGANEGDLFLVQQDQTVYAMVLLTSDYDAVAAVWEDTLNSFTIGGEAPVAAEPAETEEEAATTPAGDYTSDSGFRPEVNGFSFENYGNDAVEYNLTATELQRMFGDQVCASLAGGACILIPPAKQWMEQINGYMDDGHCEGMAVLSLLMYYDIIDPGDFGGQVAHDLSLNDEALQREIAYWWTTQSVFPAASSRVNESPSAVLDTLIETFSAGPNATDSWAMGIYLPDFSGGHAITPFAVEDQGNGIFHILVYDNNFPDETRVVTVDRNADTWSYQASINPNEPESLYEGDAGTGTLEIVPSSNRLVQQTCDFCEGNSEGSRAGLAALAQQYNEIWLTGETDLLITDEQGRRVGYVDGQFVNEIPGAQSKSVKFQTIDIWDVDNEPVYRIPVGVQFSMTVDASRATTGVTSTVAMIGPGYDLVIADLYLDPGMKDVITVSPDGSEVSYQTEYNDAPDMIFGVVTPQADYEFIVAALDIEVGTEFRVKLDLENGDLSINTNNAIDYGVYEIVMDRIDDEGEQWFNNNDIYLEPGDTAYLNFLEWDGPGSSMYVDIDYGSDGSFDESIELPDEYEAE